MKIELRLPRPDTESPAVIRGGGVAFSFPGLADLEHDLASLVPLLQLQASATTGQRFRLKFKGLVALGEPFASDQFPEIGDFYEVARVVARLEQLLDVTLRIPSNVTIGELKRAQAVVSALEGVRGELPHGRWHVEIEAGQVSRFLQQLTSEPFPIVVSSPEYTISIGDLDVACGPCAVFAPAVRVENRDELRTHDGSGAVTGALAPVGEPVYLLPREEALKWCEKGELGSQDGADPREGQPALLTAQAAEITGTGAESLDVC